MKFGKPIKIDDGLFQIRAVGARVTVLVEDDKVLLVDAGARLSWGVILKGLKDINLTPAQIDQVVVTHHHPDHSGGLSGLVAATPVKVAAHRIEAPVIQGTEPLPSPFRQQFLATAAKPVVSSMIGGPVAVDETLNDGDVLPFGSGVRVIHVPGHTAGSIALYVPAKKAIIVGDALQYRFARKLGPPAPMVTQRPEEAIGSLEKLLSLDFDVICFSHFPPMREQPHTALRELVERYRG